MWTRLFLLCFCTTALHAQSYKIRTSNWEDAGFQGPKPVFNHTVNILSHGGDNTGTLPNDNAFKIALAALNNQPGVIFFPAGSYRFGAQISLNRDSLILSGSGHDSTKLLFDMNNIANNCINVYGASSQTDTTSFTSDGLRDSTSATVQNTALFTPGNWIYVQCNDSMLMNSAWAFGSLGQIMKISQVNGNALTFKSPFRFNYALALKPKLTKLLPRRVIGIQCLSIKRLDATNGQSSLISFDRAVECWVHGVEGDSSNYAHVELNRSSNISICSSYFHHAHAYGGSGQGYGVALQFSAGENKLENNVFRHLRHSILFQAGANGNVAGYNYSFDPHWVQGLFPSNSAGDIVFHGNFPFANLCEGNINQNTVADNSHGKNGPHNTLFRNRMELYGLIINSNNDSMQILGNEITNLGGFLGLYSIAGQGHLQVANIVKGTVTPLNSKNLNEHSLYLQGNERPLCFNQSLHHWPSFGETNTYNTGSNAAKDRTVQNKMALCECIPSVITSHIRENNIELITYPNPANDKLRIETPLNISNIIIQTSDGRTVMNLSHLHTDTIDLSDLSAGLYLLAITFEGTYPVHVKVLKN